MPKRAALLRQPVPDYIPTEGSRTVKSSLKLAVLAIAATMSIPAHAATVTDPFDVIVNLTGACRISAAPTDININHAAFAAATTGTSNFTVQCSQGLLYGVTMPLSSAD